MIRKVKLPASFLINYALSLQGVGAGVGMGMGRICLHCSKTNLKGVSFWISETGFMHENDHGFAV